MAALLSNGFALISIDDDDDEDDRELLNNLSVAKVEKVAKESGLDVEADRILEIACVITNGMLTKSVEGPDLVIHQTKECLDKMGEWCQEHHTQSGLTEAVLKSTITEEEAEEQVIAFIKKYVGESSKKPLLAGNSVYTDLFFLRKYMPKLASMFNHMLVDVSTVKMLRIFWYPKEKVPKKESTHRAMDDIRESIKELKYYKENIFRQRKHSR